MSKTKIALFILIAAYTIYFSWLTISRHRGLFSGRYDLGNMEQTIWNSSQGRIFQMTDPNTNKNTSRLAFHADFLLILIAPIYKIFPHTETLLIIQAFVVAFGAIPVFLIAKHIFSVGEGLTTLPIGRVSDPPLQQMLPLLFSFLYLLSPVLQRANIFEFHSEVLSVTFLLFTFYFLSTSKLKSFLFFFFLSLISKETVSLTLVPICFWGIVKNKNRTLCIFLIFFCLAYFFLMVKFLIPGTNQTTLNHFALRHFEGGELGLEKILSSYISNPFKIIFALINEDSREYFRKIFSGYAFLPFLSPLTFLFSVPTILINIIVKDPQFRSLNYQYSATLIPGLIISTIYGVKFIAMKSLFFRNNLTIQQFNNHFILFICLLFTIYNLRLFSPLPFIGKSPYLDFLTYHYSATEKINEWEKKIPEEKSVTFTNNVGAHFSKHENIYLFPKKIGESDYVVFATKSWQDPISNEKKTIEIKKLQNNKNYSLVDSGEDYFIFQKK